MSSKVTILVVEDEQILTNLLGAVLAGQDYRTLTAATGETALQMAASHTPDLILLDLGLPDRDGMEVLARLREWSDVPVIVLSARQDEQDKVSALDAGANDYVTKPFGNRELLARIRTCLRQAGRARDSRSLLESELRVGGFSIHYAKRQVSMEGAPVHLTPMEYRIVALLAKNAGMVLTHDHILREIWGPFASDSQLLRVNMANIRRKLEQNPADPRYILTEVGVGYRLVDEAPP